MADISVCIVNWNTREFLRDCLRSLQEQDGDLSLQIIVVDNASTDGSTQMVAEDFPDVELVALEENVGYAAGNNVAIERAGGNYILLLNPDIFVRPGSLKVLYDFLENHPRAGAVAPRLIQPDGSIQLSCRSFPDPDVIFLEAFGLSRLFPETPLFGKYRMSWWDYGGTRQVDQPMASALLIRSEALESVGELDERFPIFFNDVDLCRRLWDDGWEIWFDHEAEMDHEGGASTRQVKRRMIIESHTSLLRYYDKHYRDELGPVYYALTTGIIRIGMWLRLAIHALSPGRSEN